VFLLAAYFLLQPLPPLTYITLFIVVALSLVSGGLVLALLAGRALGWASLVYVALIFLRAVVIALPGNPDVIASPFVSILTIPLIVTSLLMNRRALVIMVVLTSLDLCIVTGLNALSLLLHSPQLTPLPAVLVFSIVVFIFDGLLLSLFAGGQVIMLQRGLNLVKNVNDILGLGQQFVTAISLDDLALRVAQVIRERLAIPTVQFFVVNETTSVLVQHETARGVRGEPRQILLDAAGILTETVRQGKPRLILLNAPAFDRTEMFSGVYAQWLYPLQFQGKTIGLLDVQTTDPNGFGVEALTLLEGICTQIAIAIAHLQLQAHLRDLERDSRVRPVASSVVTTEIGALGWSQYLGGRLGGVIGFDWQQGSIVANTTLNPVLQRAMLTNAPEVQAGPTEKVLTVPITSRGQTLGAMEFHISDDREWNPRSIELARVIAQRLALALDNIRLFEQAQLIAHREQVANQVAAELQSKTDIDSLLTTAAETFQQALGATRASIRLGMPASKDGKS
jgi:GAF domain-containing protein